VELFQRKEEHVEYQRKLESTLQIVKRKGTRVRKRKNTNSCARRPMNAFMLFAKRYRLEITQKHPGKDNRYRTRLIFYSVQQQTISLAVPVVCILGILSSNLLPTMDPYIRLRFSHCFQLTFDMLRTIHNTIPNYKYSGFKLRIRQYTLHQVIHNTV
jgi:hypothetical protein